MGSFLKTAWLLARKDLRVFRRDRSGMLLGFLLPIGLVTVFGFVMQFAFGGSGSMAKAELWFQDEDASETSAQMVTALRDSNVVKLRPRAGEEAIGREGLRTKLADGEAHHALIIEAGFEEALQSGELPRLTLMRDPGREMEDQLIRIGLMQAVMAATDGDLWPAMIGFQMRQAGLQEGSVKQIVAAAQGTHGLIEKFFAAEEEDDEGAAGEDGEAAGTQVVDFMQNMIPVQEEDIAPPARPKDLSYMLAQSVSGIIVMMLMFGLMACGVTLIQEEEQGTLRRLLTASVSRNAILGGKFIFTAIMGVLQLAVLFVYGELIFKVGFFQKPLTLLVISLSLLAAITSFGLVVAAWAKTMKQAEGVSTLLILVMSALGGAWFPVQLFDMPVYAERITQCTLTYWAMNAYQQMMWNQMSWHEGSIPQSLLVLWGFALVAGFLAWKLYQRRLAKG
ncbi:MAG: ABC transporter permease [Planctomycetota bacterium]|nr:MAG: ABC transporter permease [Planctomycetota bacterium]